MSNTGLEVNTSEMDTRGKETVSAAEQLAQQIASLTSNIEELMTIWIGPSATAFHELFEEEKENLNKFQNLIYELGENISEGASILNRTEEENTGLFGGR